MSENKETKSKLKTRVQFSTTLGKDTMQRLRNYSSSSMIPLARIIDAAVNEYLDKVENKNS